MTRDDDYEISTAAYQWSGRVFRLLERMLRLRITRWISSLEGVKPFHAVRSEHPHINYRHVPVRSLYELQGMARALEEQADRVGCPTLLLQGTADPVVDPDGARLLQRKVGERTCRLEWIPSSRHGILHEDIAGTQARILSFLSEL